MEVIEAICSDIDEKDVLDVKKDIEDYLNKNTLLYLSKNTKLNFLKNKKILKITWRYQSKKKESILLDNCSLQNSIHLGSKQPIEVNLKNLYSHKRLLYYFNTLGIYYVSKINTLDITNRLSLENEFYHINLLKSTNLDHLIPTDPLNQSSLSIEYETYSIFQTIIYIKNGYLKKDLVLGIDLNDYKLNLIAHVVPRDCEMLELNMNYIAKNLKLFNNKIILSIATDSNLENKSFLNKWINLESIKVIEKENSSGLGESISFRDLIKLIENTNGNEYTFYCHTKGISKHNDNNSSIAVWIELMYKHCLANIDVMILSGKIFGGAIRSFNLFPKGVSPPWHFTGTFYWFSHILFKHRNVYSFILDDYYATEMFPGFVVKLENSICFLKDKADPFYECFLDKNMDCIVDNLDILESETAKAIVYKINELITIDHQNL